MQRKNNGFTLIELILVIAIIIDMRFLIIHSRFPAD